MSTALFEQTQAPEDSIALDPEPALGHEPAAQAESAVSARVASSSEHGPSVPTLLATLSAVDALARQSGRPRRRSAETDMERTVDLAEEASKALTYAYDRWVVLSSIAPDLSMETIETLAQPNPPDPADRAQWRVREITDKLGNVHVIERPSPDLAEYLDALDEQKLVRLREQMAAKPAQLKPFLGIMAVALATRLEGLSEQVKVHGGKLTEDPGYKSIMHAAKELGIVLKPKRRFPWPRRSRALQYRHHAGTSRSRNR